MRYFHRSAEPRSRVFNWQTHIAVTLNSEWFNPVLEHWGDVRPSESSGRAPLSPKFPKNWEIIENVRATALGDTVRLNTAPTGFGFRALS